VSAHSIGGLWAATGRDRHWLLGLDQYVGSGASITEELERWRMTDAGKDYLKRATHHWGRAEIAHGEREAKAMKRAARACAFYSKLAAH